MNRNNSWIAITLLILVTAALATVFVADPMAEALRNAQPGEHHRHMARLEGSWTAEAKLWAEPGAPPLESMGTAEIQATLGGRFFETTYSGEMMGMPFRGFGLDGYDNRSGKHIGIWADNMGTMLMVFEGDCSEDGKTLTQISNFIDPQTGAPTTMKGVTRFEDDDRHTWVAYVKPQGEGEYSKVMEIVYTRR